MPQYALYFVPHKLEREKLALLRRQLCKRFENRKAVMYPVHMTLVRKLSFTHYKSFIQALVSFCAAHKPVKLKAEQRLTTRTNWGGIVIEPSQQLLQFQNELISFVAEHGDVEPFPFDPHVSLVYAKNLPSLHNRTSPVKKLLLDRVSLVMQTTPRTPFRVVKHFSLSGLHSR